MRHLLYLLFIVWAVPVLVAQTPDTTSIHATEVSETNVLDFTPLDGLKPFFDPVGHSMGKAFSFPRFSTFPGETEPYNNIRYNLADGLFLGLGSDTRHALWLDSSLLVHGGFGYAFGSHYWQVFGGLDKRFGARETATLIGAEGHILTSSYDSWRSAAWENSLFSLVGGSDARNWFRRRGWSLHLEQYVHVGLSASVKYEQENYEFLPKDGWTMFGGIGLEAGYRKSPFFEQTQTRAVIAAVTYSAIPQLRRFLSGIRAHIQTEVGTHTDSYSRTLAEVVWHQPFWPALTLNARVRMGSATGDVIQPKLFTLGGQGTLPGFAWSEYIGNRMVLLNAEVLFHPAPFSLSRFWSNISFALLANAGYTSAQEAGASPLTGLLPNSLKNWHTDVGLGFGTRNGLVLVGGIWRTDTGQSSFLIRYSQPF